MNNTNKIQLIVIIAFIMLFVNIQNSYAQANGITANYTGTWHYDTNNERFIVKIWKDGNIYRGHYKKVQLSNGSIGNTIYNSRLNDGFGGYYPKSSIYTGFSDQYGLTGLIDDNGANSIYNPRRGNLQMKMNQMVQGCQTCMVKASWKVTSTGGLMVGDPPPFSVPLDIELTKVSNTITLD